MMALKKFVSLAIRNILCYLPSLHLIPFPDRPNGISLCIRTKNEEWIDLSLRSVKGFADEIIVVDTSTDDTPQRIRSIAEEYNLNIKLICMKDNSGSPMSDTETHTQQSNLALRNTTYRWIFKWDGDFIARTSGEYDIKKLRNKILKLNPTKYYMIFLSYVNLYGDLFHTIPGGVGVSKEAHLFTYSPFLEFKNVGRFERLKLPKYYKPLWINDIYIFHLAAVKSSRYILYRRYWTDWREVNDYSRFPTLTDYVKYRLSLDYGISNLVEGEKVILKELCQRLVPYDKEKYGDYPEVLKEELANPRYLMVYRDGKIIGRKEKDKEIIFI
jgi:glycosyltransferase involved in cell wall biosynthesis